MHVLVCDDEPLARQRLVRWLQKMEAVVQVAEAENGKQAVLYCQEHSVDVVLLDVRMPVMDGLDAAKQIKQLQFAPEIIFCTAYDEHAIDAFRVQALDYLLKPVRKQQLEETLQRLPKTSANKREHISANTHKGVEFVAIEDVRCFVAEQKYVTAYFPEGELLIDDTLASLAEEFADVFIRTHRSALVAKQYIQRLEIGDSGAFVVLSGVEQKAPVSRRLLPSIRELLQQI